MIEPQAKPARQVIRLMWDSLYDGTRSLGFGGLRPVGWPERATNGNSRLRKT
jgi:hypothetical protein